MPLRKHFLYTDARGRRSLDHDAYYLLQQKAYAELPARVFREASVDLPRSFRRGLPVLAQLLHAHGKPVELRTFTSRKGARKNRSKLHAVKVALTHVRSLRPPAATPVFTVSWAANADPLVFLDETSPF